MDLAFELTSPLGLAALAGAGLAAGFINVLAGGGSMLTLPLLMLLGLPADIANGTNRLATVTQSVSGLVGFHAAGKLVRGALAPVVAPTVLGAFAGAVAATQVPTAVLKPVLLITMMAMAALFALMPALLDRDPAAETSLQPDARAVGGLLLAGFYGGFVQAGVGFVLLAVISGMLGFDLVRANALKLVCTLCFGAIALAVFAAADQVAWWPAAVLAAATVVGAQVGVRFALRVSPKTLRWLVFGCVVAFSVGAWLRAS